MTVDLARPLDAGPHGVRWTVRSGDANPVRGTFAFTVQTSKPSESAAAVAAVRPTPSEPSDTAAADSARALDAALTTDPTQGIRWFDQGLRAVFYAVGVFVFLIAVWEGSRREARRLTRLTSRLAFSTAIVVVAQVVVRSARTAGGWSGAVAGIRRR